MSADASTARRSRLADLAAEHGDADVAALVDAALSRLSTTCRAATVADQARLAEARAARPQPSGEWGAPVYVATPAGPVWLPAKYGYLVTFVEDVCDELLDRGLVLPPGGVLERAAAEVWDRFAAPAPAHTG
jgi:hypothetical protein